MRVKPIETLEARSRDEWRKWLQENHDSRSEIWLVFYKRSSGVVSLGYGDAVEEALCFGWIDSLVRRLDEARYARKFTPRKAGSRWSTINRRRYADLKSCGLLAAPGLKRAPTSLSGDAPRPDLSAVPSYIEETLKDQSACLAIFRAAGSVIPANVHRVDRVGQTGPNKGSTSSRSTQPVGVWQEAGLEMMKERYQRFVRIEMLLVE